MAACCGGASLEEIAAAKIVNIPWYRGWGMRRLRDGWLYNVSGAARSSWSCPAGRTFTIGSDEPETLLAAIERARARRAPAAA